VTSISRRQAIGKVAFAGSVVGAGLVAGSVGYLSGLSNAASVTLTQTMTTIREVTVAKKEELEPVEITVSMATGGRGVSPPWLLLEQDRELAQKYAITVKFNLVAGSGAAVADLVDKRADITGPGDAVSSIVAGIGQGAPIKIIYFTVYGSLFGLIASNKSGFTTLDDIRRHVKDGKKVRVGYSRPGAPSHQYMWFLEELVGGKVDNEIEGISLGDVNAIIAALERGDIDLWIWSLDTMWRLQDEGRAKAIMAFSEFLGSDWHEFAIATRTDILADRRKLMAVSRFIAYWRELVKKYYLNPEESINFMMQPPPKGYGMSRAVAEKFYSAYRANYVGSPIPNALRRMREIFQKSGSIANPPSINEWFDLQLL